MNPETPITVRFEDAQLNRVAGPPESASVDHELHLKAQEHEARLDAPGYDLPTWQSMGGKKAAGEVKLDTWLDTQLQEATSKIADAQSTADALHATQETNLIVDGPGLPRNTRTTLAVERATVEKIAEDITETEEARANLAEILNGTATDPDGISWPGEVPPKPGPDTTHRAIRWSSASIKDALLTWTPFVVLGLVDGYIIANNIKDHLRTDDWTLAVTLSVAFLGLLVVLPSFIGRGLARVVRRGVPKASDIIALVAMAAFWMAAVAGSVYFRVTFDVNEAILREAARAEVTPDKIVAADVYDMGMGIFTWTVAIAAVGVIVIAVEWFLHNPIVGQILRTDHHLVDLYTALNTHQVIFEKSHAMIEGSAQAARDAVGTWQHHKDEILPAQARECAEHYRSWLVRTYNDPAYTIAIMGRGV